MKFYFFFFCRPVFRSYKPENEKLKEQTKAAAKPSDSRFTLFIYFNAEYAINVTEADLKGQTFHREITSNFRSNWSRNIYCIDWDCFHDVLNFHLKYSPKMCNFFSKEGRLKLHCMLSDQPSIFFLWPICYDAQVYSLSLIINTNLGPIQFKHTCLSV